MLSLTSRGLRLSLGILLVAGAFALAPATAHAQWTNPVCMDAEEIPALFVGEFAGLDNCESLCKKTASYCKKFVKDAASCEKVNNGGSWYFFNKLECEQIEDSAERKECKQFVNQAEKEVKQGIESEKDEALANCQDYQADCIADCSMILE
jgi:hypothetical protein